jgi:type I restriction enzyme, S subunit
MLIIASVDNIKKVIESSKRILGKDAPSRARKIIQQGDVIVSTVRPNLNAVALVPSSLDNEICSTGFSVLRPSPKTTSEYVLAFVTSHLFIDEVVSKIKGANYPAVGEDDVKSVPVPLPPLSLQKEFSSRVGEIRKLEADQAASRQRLEALFQSMLHQAFAGEL